MIRGGKLKIIAYYFLVTFIFQIVFPTVSLALTGGPSSPETSAFTPVGSSELVDLSTGDFSYSIPLLTVPGPNGGYPITLGYKSGVQMEQEASWVGLGWDLNVGSINRTLRGLPDDFNGDEGENIVQVMDYKPNTTISINSSKPEIFGQKVNSNISLTYNRYTGLSGGIGANSGNNNPFSLGFNLHSKDGLAIRPSVGLFQNQSHNLSLKLGAGFSTSQGFTQINFGLQKGIKSLGMNIGSYMSFSKHAPIGEINSKQKINTLFLGGGYGKYNESTTVGPIVLYGVVIPELTLPPLVAGYLEKYSGSLSIATAKLEDEITNVRGYGYLNLEHKDDDGLMDFHKENVLDNYDNSPVTYLPVLDYDVFSVSGQGVAGVFRAYRNDIPMLTPRKISSTKKTVGISGEFGNNSSNQYHVGTNFQKGHGEMMTGKWGVSGDINGNGEMSWLEDDIFLKSSSTSNPLYRSYHFGFIGEPTQENKSHYSNIKKESPVNYQLYKSNNFKIKSFKSKYPTLTSSAKSYGIKTNVNKNRDVQTNLILYKTHSDITNELAYRSSLSISNDEKYKHIGADYKNTSPIDYSSNAKNSTLQEIAVYNTEGIKYTYGVPVYNLTKEDVVFSINQKPNNPKTVTFDANDASTNNKNGEDHFYKSVKVNQAYAHSYLLTSTESSDYVDVTNNGYTDDDLGYWCKVNYVKKENFNWRAPFTKANYEEGNFSDNKDAKASFTYGTKEQYYVSSIETKTHIAEFITSKRNDNRGAYNRNQDGTTNFGAYSYKLDTLKLYKKNEDPTKPDILLKKVVFNYDYSLCNDVENNATNQGKLTLKSLYFTYQDNQKGVLTPYEFEYHNTVNYNYLTNTDRWGNYQSAVPFGDSKIFPYTNQYNSNSSSDASQWNLTKIILPSGGRIEVNYEPDTYQYVQDKRAMQMYRIVGLGQTEQNEFEEDFELDGDLNDIIYFERTDGKDITADEVEKIVAEIDYTYFKAWVTLKKKNGVNCNDYISGYLKINKNGDNGLKSGSNSIGYFTIKKEEYGENEKKIHPIQKAACQHLHLRSDLIPTVQNPIQQARIVFGGPINYYAKENKFCNKLELDNSKRPSFIRLNSINDKKGGGHRVKSVKVFSGWSDDEVYGQKYFYETLDGLSSGVADYEPIIGGEENAFKLPDNYNSILDYNSYKGIGTFFTEKPYTEAYYPAPVVKYSRVVTMPLTPLDKGITGFSLNKKNQSGIIVNEYYTAKDFPTVENYGFKDQEIHDKKAVPIPFAPGIPSQNIRGYSQGFVVELNDMAGKLKAISTFSYFDKDDLQPKKAKTRVEYVYHTDSSNPKRITNEVTTLTQDGTFETSSIGRSTDFYVHQQEDLSYDKNVDAQLNAAGSLSPLAIHYIIPFNFNNRSIFLKRTLVNNKVINKKGILKEVITTDNGRTTVSKNLAYDAYTGEALIQSQINDFDAPVYSYNYAGHWKYPALAGKYKNYRARFKVTGFGGIYSINPSTVNVKDIIQLGDELTKESTGAKVYVTEVDIANNTFKATDLGNNSQLNNDDIVYISESGYRNMQSVKVGSLVSLTNPLGWNFNTNSILQNVFDRITQPEIDLESTNTFESVCAEDSEIVYRNPQIDNIKNNIVTLSFPVKNRGCNVQIKVYDIDGNFTVSSDPLDVISYLNGLTIDLFNNPLEKVSENEWQFGRILETPIKISTDCDLSCPIEGILHASATQLADEWQYDYQDQNVKDGTGNLLAHSGSYNPIYYAQKNNWKGLRSWVYQVDRKQKGLPMISPMPQNQMEIDQDGEYETFKFFNWSAPIEQNEKNKWTWTNEITKYSPYGYELENKNALEIKSSEIYGYNHSVVTAVAANASYEEIAFDGFETNNSGSSHDMTGHFSGTVNVMDLYSWNNDYKNHSGNYVLDRNTPSSFQTSYELKTKKYVFSGWYLMRGTSGSLVIDIKQNGSSITSTTIPIGNYTTTEEAVVDGWSKFEIEFTPPTEDYVDFTISGNFVDDLRLHPFNSSMKSYIYNPITLKLEAELDYLNYGTFYNYDEEGKLTQVKKETEKGVVTVQSSRDNIAH